MDVSKFLSKAIGIYFVIICSAMFMNMSQFIANVNNLIGDAPLIFVTGFFTLILGILMVISHNIWQWNWRVIITIIAWITLIKGASIIYYPQLINNITTQLLQNANIAYVAAGIDLILGLVLCYLGFRK